MAAAPLDDPFALLGLPRGFVLDREQLQRAYLRRSAGLHPDRVADPLLQAEAARESARLNAARATLADDEQRANALLTLLGGPSKESDKALPDGFLVQMMEARQDMEAALSSGDAAERARIERWAAEQRQDYVSTVASLFGKIAMDGASSSPAHLAEIRRQLNAWRYIERMIEQLDPGYSATS